MLPGIRQFGHGSGTGPRTSSTTSRQVVGLVGLISGSCDCGGHRRRRRCFPLTAITEARGPGERGCRAAGRGEGAVSCFPPASVCATTPLRSSLRARMLLVHSHCFVASAVPNSAVDRANVVGRPVVAAKCPGDHRGESVHPGRLGRAVLRLHTPRCPTSATARSRCRRHRQCDVQQAGRESRGLQHGEAGSAR